MCGIVGYVGSKKATPILFDGLLRLEYRGYDSAGLSVIENNSIFTLKHKGRVQNLIDLEKDKNLNGSIGIAHTRWATHGKPSTINSHPHTDENNIFSVVHNGIIENYKDLRSFLTKENYNLKSETDSEVIPNLIHYFYNKHSLKSPEEKFRKAVTETCLKLEGNYAIEVICSMCPNMIIVARHDSPLVIGTGENENFICSDIPAILSYTKDFYLLENDEIAVISKDNLKFFTKNLKPIFKDKTKIEWDLDSSEKNGYEDFMLKEIFEQPKAVSETISPILKKNEPCIIHNLDLSSDFLKSIQKIYIVACGTAMHAGLASKPIFEALCNIPVEVDIASEFRYRNPIINEKTLCLFISQSGETADTIAALKLAKENNAKTIAISNVLGSSITREADYTLYTHAGPEIAVASTKAYTSQISLLASIAICFSEKIDIHKDLALELKNELLSLSEKLDETLKNTSVVKDFAKQIYKEKNMFFIGRGSDYTTSAEGSLKLKEISYIHSESYAAGELKHGPIALIENGVTVVAIMTNPELTPKTVSNVCEVISRGAKTFVITNQDIDKTLFNEVVTIPKTHSLLSPILAIVPLQLLAYYISKEKGLDVDKPRNLAKSVTVE